MILVKKAKAFIIEGGEITNTIDMEHVSHPFPVSSRARLVVIGGQSLHAHDNPAVSAAAMKPLCLSTVTYKTDG